MQLLIKFPTRNRPDTFLQVLDQYISMMEDQENYSVVVSADVDDGKMNTSRIRHEVDKRKNTSLFFGKNTSKIQAVNADLKHAGDFDILLLASDDMIPVVPGFDSIIRSKMQQHFPDTDGALFFNDGHTGNQLNTLSILGRKYFDRFGYIYHPAYTAFYCDNEHTEVAKKLDRMAYFPEVIIRHEHCTFDGRTPDELYTKSIQFFRKDQRVYQQRQAINFDLKGL